MVSLEQFVTAITQLGYNNFEKLKVALDNGDRRRAKSVWGNLSMLIFRKNKPNTRSSLYLKWKLNRSHFQDFVKQGIEGNSRKSITDTGSDTYQLAVEHISTRLDSVSIYVNSLDPSNSNISQLDIDISVGSLEREVSNSNFLGLLASGCEQPELYSLRSTMASSPPQTEATDTNFWTYIDCDSLLWLEALKFFGSECPPTSGEFMFINGLCYEECKKFSQFLGQHLQNLRLVKRGSCLLEAWILVGNLNCRVMDLFGNAYLVFTVTQLEEILNFAISVRENLDLIFPFHSTLSEKIGTINSSKIPLLVDSHPDITLDMALSETSVVVNKYTDNSGQLVPTPDVGDITNEVIIDESIGMEVMEQSKGNFFVSFIEWENITKIEGDRVILSKDWTNLFNSKLEGMVTCVLCFKYHKINKSKSRKQNSCFFRAKAECKFTNCFEFTFIIQKNPLECHTNDGIIVDYLVSGTLSNEHSDSNIVYARNLCNSNRLEVATQVADTSVSKYFYNQFESTENRNLALNFGNLNKIKSAAVLRKAKFDLSSLQRYSNDNWSELISLQQYYHNAIVGSNVRGYIQSLGHNPFIIHLYTEDQIKILKSFKDISVILHLDATGSIIRKIEPSQQKVFYYALTIQHPTYSTSPVPLAEMISSGHTSAEISYFLHKWHLDAKKILGTNINIGQIEIDFSWALIHSVCNAFLKCDIDAYLDKCWNKVDVNSANQELELKVILHLCSAHLMHGVGFHINRKFKLNKEVRKLFLHSFGFIVRCSDIALINTLFSSLCYVFKSKYLNEHVLANIKTLESYINDNYSDLADTNDNLDNEDSDNDPIEIKDGKTLRDRSPFGKHFTHLSKQCENTINNDHINGFDSNPCYYPNLIEYILTYYLPILPLWSGVILGPHSVSVGKNYSTYSNAIVENWMRIVKIDILDSKSHLRPGDFIRILYPCITSRISAFNFAFHPRADKIYKSRKRMRDISEEKCSEEWSKKKKQYCGYLKSKTYEFPQFNRNKSVLKSKLIPIKCEKLSTLRKNCKSPEIKPASIITDEELVETSMIHYVLPGFRPPHIDWQISTCKKWKLQFCNQVAYSLDNIVDKGEGLYKYDPCLTETISGDGNCYFSTISYLITGSTTYHKELRAIIVENMLGKLSANCNKFLRTKYVYTQGNFRNIQDWVNKMGMNKVGKWATDLEIFATSLLFNIDIWVFLGPVGSRWIGFSGNGSSFDQFLKEPTSNGLYIQNLGNHYQPIKSLNYVNLNK